MLTLRSDESNVFSIFDTELVAFVAQKTVSEASKIFTDHFSSKPKFDVLENANRQRNERRRRILAESVHSDISNVFSINSTVNNRPIVADVFPMLRAVAKLEDERSVLISRSNLQLSKGKLDNLPPASVSILFPNINTKTFTTHYALLLKAELLKIILIRFHFSYVVLSRYQL